MIKNQVFQLYFKYLSVLVGIFFTLLLNAGNFFYVQLKDKNNTPYTIHEPETFLSERAISRRKRLGIAIDSTDLPVNPAYIQQIADKGVKIHSTSRWMNGITILCSDTSVVSQIRAFGFVSFVEYTGLEGENSIQLSKISKTTASVSSQKVVHNTTTESIPYGSTKSQTEQINADAMHQEGYFGQGIEVAVIDAGFKSVDVNRAFDSLRTNHQLLDTYNVIYPDSNVYIAHEHGANVLSIMSGNLSGEFLGIAPKASYRLILSEYSPTEYLCEVDFWVRAIEYADSTGSDLVNSSLGYAYFDDSNLNFSYADMNGEVSRASRAAEMAANKGMVICASAGNEALHTWKYIGSPADADKILAVGAVESDSTNSTFSSFGPASDGRIKPDVSAQGTSTSYVNYNGTVTYGNGTSYSSPIIAGAMTCLLEYIYKNNKVLQIEDLLDIVRANSHFYYSPDPQQGYGIPDFGKIMIEIGSNNSLTTSSGSDTKFFVIKYGYINLRPEYITDKNNTLGIYDPLGRLLKSSTGSSIDIHNLEPGIYILKLSTLNLSSKFIIQ